MDNRKGDNEDLKEIGQLYNGRIEPKRWVPITRNIRARQPYPPTSESWRNSDTTLWAGIASFRDARCGLTLFNMFSKATYPKRLRAGVVQQNEEGDISCLKKYCELWKKEPGVMDCPHLENIRVLELDAREAQGPCWGRHMQSYLLADEEFCMQTDSHMDFVQGWDTLMMEEWAATRNEYGVLSTYVQGLDNLGENVNGLHEVSHLCEVLFPQAQPRNMQARAIHQMTEPKMTTTWGAGYSFSKCHAERAVPYDPYLPQIFDGEEFSKMLRLWTNGYDVYTPHRSYIVHDYKGLRLNTMTWRANAPTVDKEGSSVRVDSNQRLWNLMEMPGSTEEGSREVQADPWGLGDKRTLDQFIEFTGVDVRTKSWIGITGDRCGSGVEWVPFDCEENSSLCKPDSDPNLRGVSPSTAKAVVGRPSWRTREGKDPIEVGPYWADMKSKLEDSGVDVWWSPSRYDPVPRGEAPHAGFSAAERAEVNEGLESADTSDTQRIHLRDIPDGGEFSLDKRPGDGPDIIPVDEKAAPVLELPVPRSHARSVRTASWPVPVGIMAAMGGMLLLLRSRRGRPAKQRERRKRGRRSNPPIDDWSANAFSTGCVSPLGMSSLVWQPGTDSRKDRKA